MSTLALLDAAIGFTFLFATYSIACSAIVEWASATFQRRSRLLDDSLNDLLGTTLKGLFDKHQMINGLKVKRLRRTNTYPDYLPNEVFALTFMNVTMDFTPGAPGAAGTVAVKPGLTDPNAKQLAESIMQGTNNVGPVQARLERWFGDAMETASGRYKRMSQIYTIVAAILVTFVFHVDALRIIQDLYANAPLRDNIVALAQKADPSTFRIGGRSPLLLPIGYASASDGVANSLGQVPGYFLSIVGLSFGAPFWFDLLKTLVNVRQAGTPPNEKKPAT